ncbi:MAG: type VI secretion system-associated FHA domain protein [Gammaproteobacteria bacterium]
MANQHKSINSSADARPKNSKLGKTVVQGMSLLIQGQRQFAEEFGLSNARVFPQSHYLLDGQSPDKCLKQIFRSGDLGIAQLQEIFNDMIEHQLALFSAIDAVAKEALTSLSPKNVQSENPSRFTTGGNKWRFYKSYHKEFQVNDSFRFNMIVAPGFVKKYSSIRENQN